MRVDDDARGNAESRSQYYVCGLATNTSQLDQLVQILWYFSVVLLYQSLTTGFYVFRLGPEKASALDQLLKTADGGFCQLFRSWIAFEKLSGDDIDSLISALGREDCGHEELYRSFEVQSTNRV